MKKTMTVEEFRKYVKLHDANKINHHQMKQDEWKKSFTMVCKKCGSMNIEFFGEAGVNYGGQTGYDDGENGFKCIDCGNAITWWA